MYHFIENLRLLDARKTSNLYAGDISDKKSLRKREEDKIRDQEIDKYSNLLNNEKITVEHFLISVSKVLAKQIWLLTYRKLQGIEQILHIILKYQFPTENIQIFAWKCTTLKVCL